MIDRLLEVVGVNDRVIVFRVVGERIENGERPPPVRKGDWYGIGPDNYYDQEDGHGLQLRETETVEERVGRRRQRADSDVGR